MMAQTQPSRGTAGIPPAGFDDSVIADGRDPARQSSRRSDRMFTAPEPHQKYEVYDEEFPEGTDLLWLPTVIAGMENKRAVMEHHRAGWIPAAAKDFPRLSGYGHEVPEALLSRGLVDKVDADDPIVIDGQMLVMRPKHMSVRAHRERELAAQTQVENQMQRLRQASRAFRGTQTHRRFAPLPGESGSDQAAQEE